MNYRTPLVISFVCSAAGAILFFTDYQFIAQIAFTTGFIMSFGAFKKRAGIVSAMAHFFPSWFLSFIYFQAASPLVAISLIIASLQNVLLELFAPSKMYNTAYTRIVCAIAALSCYVAGNYTVHAGWQLWAFPGLCLFAADILSFMILSDMKKLLVYSDKGFIIKAGSTCPDFNLPDETGKMVSKSDFAGKYLLMIFVRGDWCPGCHIMLRTYQRNKEKFAERGVNLLSIGPDPLGVNKEMVEKLGLNYHILSDQKQTLAKQFCVELQSSHSGSPQGFDFIPLPASFLIDKSGVVRYTSRADKAGEILNPAQVFEVLDTLT